MSRSRKKHPGGGMAVSHSDKPYKVQEHKRERRHVKAVLSQGQEPEPKSDYGSPWNSPKDGKQYWVDHDDKWMRK